MAVEAARGCGFRKVGGLYLVGGELAAPCDRLPWLLDVCPCCGAGIKFTRGWTWIDPVQLFQGDHDTETSRGAKDCYCDPGCPVCFPSMHFDSDGDRPRDGQAGLLWIGEKFYPTPADFVREGAAQGISRRISCIPHHFKVGRTWVFLAHIKAVLAPVHNADGLFKVENEFKPGIFAAFRPRRIERIVLQSEFDLFKSVMDLIGTEELEKCLNQKQVEICLRLKSDTDRGITLVPVPDDDKDHNPDA